jgi:hypothetical protein
LLLPPAVTDNAAMEDEPSQAEPKRKRRWYRFRLRTLFAIMALLFIAWYGNQIRLTMNRQAVRHEIAHRHGSKVYFFPGDHSTWLPFWFFCDEAVELVSVSRDTKLTAEEESLIHEWFPETRIE